MRKTVFLLTLLIVFLGCSSKEGPEYNKSDSYWYKKIVHYVSVADLDKADESYTSLQSEHFASPLLKEATLALAIAHMDNEEYLMAKYYLDEYIKRFGTPSEIEFAKFLKIKASFLAFKNINRDQKLLQDTIQEAKEFKKEYQQSNYNPMVDTMLTKLHMAEYVLNKEIAELYKRTGKEKAAKIYEKRIRYSWLKEKDIEVPTSWYDYLINW